MLKKYPTVSTELIRRLNEAILHEEQIRQDIARMKALKIDKVILSLHWGEEYVAYPLPMHAYLVH